jgi:hypothetical protein
MFRKLKKTFQIYKQLSQSFTELDSPNDDEVNKQHIIIPIFYWGDTFVSWVQIIFSLTFAKRNSHIYFVYDDEMVGKYNFSINSLLVRRLVKKICYFSNFTLLTSKDMTETKDDFSELILKKHYFAAQWQEKRSIKLSDFKTKPLAMESDQVIAGKIDNLLMTHSFDFCFCPGGIYGNSYLWRGICDERSIRFSSFDGDETKLILTSSGVAAHRTDIETRFHKTPMQDMKKLVQQVQNDIYKRSKLKLKNLSSVHDRKTRKEGLDPEVTTFFNDFAQKVSRSDVLKNATIFLNTSWDAAALDLEPWKTSQLDWLDLLVGELIQNGCRNLSIRQHPDEQFFPSQDKYSEKVNNYRKTNQEVNFHLIEAHQEINSYELIKDSSIVFTFSSTIGLEACVLNRPTFVFKDNYQSKLGALPRYTSGSLNDNLDSYFKDCHHFKLKSALAYYYGQLCGWHDISIPDLDDFLSKESWNQIIDEIATDVMSGPI